jgi:energy-coupling factor transporter transmembrane protein EcfT
MKLGPRGERMLLLLWLAACFAYSAITDPVVLLILLGTMALAFWRQAPRAARRTLLSAVPLTLALVAASWAYTSLYAHADPPWRAYLGLALRTTLIAFTTFAVLQRVNLLRAFAPWPALMRLLTITLAQIHALRLLAVESRLGLRSRLPRKPTALLALRNAGGVTTTMLTLSHRNAQEISEAMRARGF